MHQGKHRIALAVAKGTNAGKPAVRDPAGEAAPRTYIFDDEFAPNWDESILSGTVPTPWRLAREVLRRQAEYDAVLTWSEKLSLAMLMQQPFVRASKPHIA